MVNPETPRRNSDSDPRRTALDLARRVLTIEADAVRALVDRVDSGFFEAVRMILECRGRIIVSGIGKSGHIARKIASTMASTGTPAHFVHPAEASHGDLGMVLPHDVFLCVSNSGESDELLRIVPLVKRQGARLIAMTGNAASALALEADVHLDSAVQQEACPLNLAPTASTTAALALGDALAIALLDARGFSEADFARAHPGGALGRRLLTHVADVMRKGASVPAVPLDASLKEALLEMTRGGIGMTAVVDERKSVAGVFTDGDLRRTFDRTSLDFDSITIRELMTRNPRVIRPDALAVEAVQLMESHKVNQMLVVDADGVLIGALNMHDLFRAKVI